MCRYSRVNPFSHTCSVLPLFVGWHHVLCAVLLFTLCLELYMGISFDAMLCTLSVFFFFQAEDGIRDHCVTGVQTCALPIFGINVPIPVPMAFHSFGGWKRSLFGDHHIHGPEGVRFYTRLKAVTSRWPEEL